ncbi:MAG: hypothetical protein ABFR95_07265 [Actinomycetota bacterium]
MLLHLRLVFIVVVLAGLAIGCSNDAGADGAIAGVVSEVTGTDEVVESFVVLDANGDSHRFAPAPDMVVSGTSQTMRDLVVSGDEVSVTYETGTDGHLIATDVIIVDR